MAIEHKWIQKQLEKKFPEQHIFFDVSSDIFTFVVDASINLRVMQFLHADLHFTFLSDLCAVHYPENKDKELCAVYQLYNLVENTRVCMKIYVPSSKPDVFTASKLFASANWMERETYDFFGINFIGHPNLIRILNVDEMDYFPLRKEFPLEDQTRTDKDDEMFGRERLVDMSEYRKQKRLK